MKNLFSFLMLLLCLSSFAQTQKRFSAVAQMDGFSVVTDSTFQGDIINWSDALAEGYLPTQIQDGFVIVDAAGNMFEIDTVLTANFGSAEVIVTERQNSTAPTGQAVVCEPFADGSIPSNAANSAGITPVIAAKINIHNSSIYAHQSAKGGNGIFDIGNTNSVVPSGFNINLADKMTIDTNAVEFTEDSTSFDKVTYHKGGSIVSNSAKAQAFARKYSAFRAWDYGNWYQWLQEVGQGLIIGNAENTSNNESILFLRPARLVNDTLARQNEGDGGGTVLFQGRMDSNTGPSWAPGWWDVGRISTTVDSTSFGRIYATMNLGVKKYGSNQPWSVNSFLQFYPDGRYRFNELSNSTIYTTGATGLIGVDDNGWASRVDLNSIGDGIYSASGTIPEGVVATIADDFRFRRNGVDMIRMGFSGIRLYNKYVLLDDVPDFNKSIQVWNTSGAGSWLDGEKTLAQLENGAVNVSANTGAGLTLTNLFNWNLLGDTTSGGYIPQFYILPTGNVGAFRFYEAADPSNWRGMFFNDNGLDLRGTSTNGISFGTQSIAIGGSVQINSPMVAKTNGSTGSAQADFADYSLPAAPGQNGQQLRYHQPGDSIGYYNKAYAEIGFGPGVETFPVSNNGNVVDVIDSTFINDNQILEGFTHSTPGILVNNTGDTLVVKVQLVAAGENSCSDANNETFRIKKNTSVVRQMSSVSAASARSPVFTVQAVLVLAPGESVRGSATAATGTACSGFAIEDYSLTVEELRRY